MPLVGRFLNVRLDYAIRRGAGQQKNRPECQSGLQEQTKAGFT
jgi:hypothetical protein